MKGYIILALLMSAVPTFAQTPEEAATPEVGIGGQFALGNLALRDLDRANDPVQRLKLFFADAKLPLTNQQEQKLDGIVEAQQKDIEALLDRIRAEGGTTDPTRALNQEYLKRVNSVLTPEQQGAWRHYRIDTIRLRGGFRGLELILEEARVPLTADQETSIQKIFENFAARRARLIELNPNPGVVETDRLVIAEFDRVIALLTLDQRNALRASRRSAPGKIKP